MKDRDPDPKRGRVLGGGSACGGTLEDGSVHPGPSPRGSHCVPLCLSRLPGWM